MRSELAACPALHSSDDAVVDKILGVWSQLQRRTYFYHETAVHAYFQGPFIKDVRKSFGISDPLPPLVRILVRSIVLKSRNLPYYVCF